MMGKPGYTRYFSWYGLFFLLELRCPQHKVHKWFQRMWLSNADFCDLLERALLLGTEEGVEAGVPMPPEPSVRFRLFNAMSGNSGMRWDISETRKQLGYSPKDDVTKHPRPDDPNRETLALPLTVRP